MRISMKPLAASALVLASSLLGCAPDGGGSSATQAFDTPEAAVEALVTALEANDSAALTRILGSNADELLHSGDAIADSVAKASFLARYHAKHEFVTGGPDNRVLQVGDDAWPLPVPLKRVDGKWHLDGEAGIVEVSMRRIGRNELHTIDVMRGFVVAQEEYASKSHDGVPAGTYAQAIKSEPGKQNGLYWEVAEGEPESPAGPLLAEAAASGYTGGRAPGAPYHGYHFRLLTSQGPAAEGGARDYIQDGRLTGGFALVAWPATYGNSGVMSFLINQDGVVWQKDLGETTEQTAGAITAFEPDTTWIPIPTEEDLASAE